LKRETLQLYFKEKCSENIYTIKNKDYKLFIWIVQVMFIALEPYSFAGVEGLESQSTLTN
jgi:hypothetical protein